MKTAFSLLIFLGCASGSIFAQIAPNFNAGLFKETETAAQKTSSIEIQDFKFQNEFQAKSAFLDIPRTKPAAALLSSAIIPGSGQAINGRWVRAGIYFTAEVFGIIYHLDRNATARRQEKAYEQFTHENWSVVAYAQWIVEYSDMYNLDQTGLEDLRELVYENGRPISPDFSNTKNDWEKVKINKLHKVENQTPFIFNEPIGCQPEECRRASIFSHQLPEYGSQQYYELISKYYQFQPGWRDFYGAVTTYETQSQDLYRYMWDGRDQPFELFYQGRDKAQEYEDNYRLAGNILKLLVINHVVSAFDAYFTVKLKNSRLAADANLLRLEQFSLTWHF